MFSGASRAVFPEPVRADWRFHQGASWPSALVGLRDGAGSEHLRQRHRHRDAFQRPRAEIVMAEPVAGQAPGRGCDDDPTGRRLRLQPRRQIGCLAYHGVGFAATDSPTTTSPVAMPTRVLSGMPPPLRAGALRVTSKAARMARSASSSWAAG
jgi:hypothetical protein